MSGATGEDAATSGGGAATVRVEVAYAERDRQTVIALELPIGATVAEALVRADLPARHGGPVAADALGIHGRVVEPARVLADGDRVEVYRRLPADPKETRRRLAREGRAMGLRPPGNSGASNP